MWKSLYHKHENEKRIIVQVLSDLTSCLGTDHLQLLFDQVGVMNVDTESGTQYIEFPLQQSKNMNNNQTNKQTNKPMHTHTRTHTYTQPRNHHQSINRMNGSGEASDGGTDGCPFAGASAGLDADLSAAPAQRGGPFAASAGWRGSPVAHVSGSWVASHSHSCVAVLLSSWCCCLKNFIIKATSEN